MVIEITDDGSGIDVEALRRRVATAAEDCEAEDWDLADLVFADGVSARREASEVSGRGVGMAAVRAAVEELGGTISVFTQPGRGTSFLIRLPFTERMAAVN